MARTRSGAAARSRRPVVVWKGEEPLRGLLVPLGELRLNPANPNRHGPASIDGIAGSLEQFGQQKPVVADRTGTVVAGNGQLEAAVRIGWTHLAAVRSTLPPSELTRYGIADNQVARLSEQDDRTLARLLRSLETAGKPVSGLGFSDDELTRLLEGVDPTPPGDPDGPNSDGDGPGGAAPQPKAGRPVLLTAEERADVDAAIRWAQEHHEDATLSEGFCLAWICRRVLGD